MHLLVPKEIQESGLESSTQENRKLMTCNISRSHIANHVHVHMHTCMASHGYLMVAGHFEEQELYMGTSMSWQQNRFKNLQGRGRERDV